MKKNMYDLANMIEEGSKCYSFSSTRLKHHRYKPSPEDLGMEKRSKEFKDIWKKQVKSGYFILFDPECIKMIDSICNSVYSEFNNMSYPWALKPLLKGEDIKVRLISKEIHDSFMIWFYDKRKSLENLKIKMTDEYENIIETTLKRFRVVAKENFNFNEDKVNFFIEKLKKKVPTPGDIENIKVALNPEFVTLPKELSIKKIAHENKTKLSKIKDEEEKEKQKKLNEIAIEQAKAINQARLNFINNTMGEFHKYVLTKLEEILQELNNKGEIPKGDSKRINTFLVRVQGTLNVAGDVSGEFEKKVQELREQFKIVHTERKIEDIKDSVKTLAKASVEKLKEINLEKEVPENLFDLLEW